MLIVEYLKSDLESKGIKVGRYEFVWNIFVIGMPIIVFTSFWKYVFNGFK